MKNLLFTLNAILPIVLPILLGFLLQKIKMFDKDFFTKVNKFAFKILIPISLFKSLYTADIKTINVKFLIAALVALLVLFVIGMVIVTLFVPDKKQKGVIHQVLFRSNYAIIGIPLATALAGPEAEAQASIIAAISVPTFNILAVIALSMYDHEDGQKVSIKSILKKIVTNPLIIGVFAGLLVIGIRAIVSACGGNGNIDVDSMDNYSMGYFAVKTISNLAACATPMVLVALGGKFEFSAVSKLWKQITFSTITRLFIVPAVMIVIFYFLGFNSAIYVSILIALFATPVAVSSAPMAEEMGQDGELAGQLVVWTSVGSAISLFIIIMICSSIGIFAA